MFTTQNAQKNKELVQIIQNGLTNFEKELVIYLKKKSHMKYYTVAQILNFNKQNQEGKGLKILTPEHTLS